MSSFPPVSYKANTTIAAQRGVSLVTGSAQTVGLAVTTSLPLGISTDTVLDTSAGIPIAVAGEAKLFFNDTCAAGEKVALDASGRGIPFVEATAAANYLGVLVDATVAATGTIAKVLINPGRSSAG